MAAIELLGAFPPYAGPIGAVAASLAEDCCHAGGGGGGSGVLGAIEHPQPHFWPALFVAPPLPLELGQPPHQQAEQPQQQPSPAPPQQRPHAAPPPAASAPPRPKPQPPHAAARPKPGPKRRVGAASAAAAAAAAAYAGPTEKPFPSAEAFLAELISTSRAGRFFTPCGAHAAAKKNEATLFCVDCAAPSAAPSGGRALCQHCAPAGHAGHRFIQIRRYVYVDVVRAADIGPFVDISGIQSYTVNQAKVVFLLQRPLSKLLPPGATDSCQVCSRALREGCTHCSIACKVRSLVAAGKLGAGALCGFAGGADGGAPAGGGCGGGDSSSGDSWAVGAPAAAAAAVAPEAKAGAALGAAAAGLQQEGGGRAGSGADADADADADWAAKRSSDASCQSHLDWHSANGHACRRKQALPRRSPLA